MNLELPRARHPVDLIPMRLVVDANRAELVRWLDGLKSDSGISVVLAQEGTRSQSWHDELLRLLFNWSSSANALVEYTRAVMADFPSLNEEFEKWRRDLVDVELASFVSRLRAVLHHIDTVPVSVARRYRDTGELVTEVVIERGLLLLVPEDWTQASRSFIERQQPTFSLRDVVTRYHEQVDALYEWLDCHLEAWRQARRGDAST